MKETKMNNLNTAQNEYLKIVLETTLETLAKTNKTTIENVRQALALGNENLKSQFEKLIKTAFNLKETAALGLR